MANIDNLFKIMAEKRVSQKELAVAINASTGNISDWKKGRSFPSAQKLDEAATFLECSVDYLLGRTNDPSNSGDTYYGDNHGFQANRGTFNLGEKFGEMADGTTEEFIQVFKNMDLADRVEVMKFAFDKIKRGA